MTTADLAARGDFRLGEALVSPATRTVSGPGGSSVIEPRVMQVLIVLTDAAGQVVTREILFERCWGGVYVGDDSLNRVIGAIRKIASEIAGGTFAVETIPRTGYRLVGTVGQRPSPGAERPLISRRQLVGGAVAIGTIAVTGGWALLRSRNHRRFETLVRAAEQAIRKETADARTIADLREAIDLQPDSARAWGLLAFLKSLDTVSADPEVAEPARKEAQEAAGQALSIDSKEPYGLLAMFELQGSTLDWADRDRRLREIIRIDPANIPAISELVLLTQAAGLNRESWNWNERAITLDPLSWDFLSKRAMKLWIAGRVAQADKVIDQVIALYPSVVWPKWARFLIYAMTDRTEAARTLLEGPPLLYDDAALMELWRTALRALHDRSAQNIAQARNVCVRLARSRGSFALDTTMILSALGEVDTAFDIANGYLLSRGLIIHAGSSRPRDDVNDATWRINTQYLFTPPCQVMRAHPRFLPLCEGMGLTEYWGALGVRPDYQLAER
jgi:DNA-binding winged helix-turn-helix (wHTH) protein/tetratricopeptide (TPR) repeat protein